MSGKHARLGGSFRYFIRLPAQTACLEPWRFCRLSHAYRWPYLLPAGYLIDFSSACAPRLPLRRRARFVFQILWSLTGGSFRVTMCKRKNSARFLFPLIRNIWLWLQTFWNIRTFFLWNSTQHGETTCLRHSLNVSYLSYLYCRDHGLDVGPSARAADCCTICFYTTGIFTAASPANGCMGSNIAKRWPTPVNVFH